MPVFDQVVAAVQDAHVRAVELVRRAGEEVALERGDIDEHVRRVVDGVHEHERAGRVREPRGPRHVGDRAERVRRGPDRDEPRLRPQRLLEVHPVELAGFGHEADAPDGHPALARDCLPRGDVGVVIPVPPILSERWT